MVQPLWKTVCRFLKKLKLELQYNPAIPPLGTYLKKTKTRQRCDKKRKLHAMITDEYRCKNPQQNTSKQNPTAH